MSTADIGRKAHLETDNDAPILFRTTTETFGELLLSGSEILMRPHAYYRCLEDASRNDAEEGLNAAKTRIPLRFRSEMGPAVEITGNGAIGEQNAFIGYMACFHGTSISEEQRLLFGGFTVGIRNIHALACELAFRASKKINVTGWRYGPVAYQHSALTYTTTYLKGAAIATGNGAIRTASADPFRKEPVKPFIEQDEWRVMIFTDTYVNGTIEEPLRIQVDSTNFFRYQC